MTKHLPESIKNLLALRNPKSWPSPPRAQLQNALSKTRKDAKSRSAETGWLVLTTCTLLTKNCPSALGYLYQFATRSSCEDVRTRGSLDNAINTAALMRESALKCAIFVGVPRTILSLAALTETVEDDVKSSLRTRPLRVATPESVESMVARGRSLWDSIYQPHADKLHDKLGSYHPDLILIGCLPAALRDLDLNFSRTSSAFVIHSYGAVLAPLPQGDVQGNLSRALTSVVGIACLRAEGGVGPQLTSHVFGLLKARGMVDQGAEDAWLASDQGAEWVIRTVDTIQDGVTGRD